MPEHIKEPEPSTETRPDQREMPSQPVPENHKSSSSFFVGAALILVGGLFLAGQFLDLGNVIWPFALAGIAVVFTVVFFSNPRERWWALIPAWVFGATGLFIMVERFLPGDLAALYWLMAVGVPFFVVFITDPRERWWALIPFYVMSVIGVFVTFEGSLGLNDNIAGAYWTGAVALPFLLVAVTDVRERWWGFIPGGILSVVSLALLLASESILAYLLPVGLIVGGLVMLLTNRIGNKGSRTEALPASGPAADRPRE